MMPWMWCMWLTDCRSLLLSYHMISCCHARKYHRSIKTWLLAATRWCDTSQSSYLWSSSWVCLPMSLWQSINFINNTSCSTPMKRSRPRVRQCLYATCRSRSNDFRSLENPSNVGMFMINKFSGENPWISLTRRLPSLLSEIKMISCGIQRHCACSVLLMAELCFVGALPCAIYSFAN